MQVKSYLSWIVSGVIFLFELRCYHNLKCDSNCQFACIKNHICIFFLIILISNDPYYGFLLLIWLIHIDYYVSDHQKLVFNFYLFYIANFLIFLLDLGYSKSTIISLHLYFMVVSKLILMLLYIICLVLSKSMVLHSIFYYNLILI